MSYNNQPKETIATKDRVLQEIPLDNNLNFETALTLLKKGKLLQRKGWNGKGMFLFLVSGSRFMVNRKPLNLIYTDGTVISYLPHIDMKTADGSVVPWLASQTDLLAEDWQLAINK